MKVAGKVVVVTGAGSGMGREVALELLRRGARVAAVDINATTLAETASLAGDRGSAISTHAMSVADRAAVDALPQAVIDHHGAVDGVINCAGIIQPFVRLAQLEDAAIERVFAVNWSGTLFMTRAFLPRLLERPAGHIVNVSSMGGFLPVPGQTIYGASKAAVKLMTEGLHSELRDTPVRVTVVFPGAVATNITANSGVTLDLPAGAAQRKVLSAAAAARIIVDGMERDAYRVMVGSDARFMDLIYRLHPRRAAAFIADQMRDLLAR
jgi:NAD(P)-dependent dehydrogenase (short-subunit alcohol dehydrogenase family)